MLSFRAAKGRRWMRLDSRYHESTASRCPCVVGDPGEGDNAPETKTSVKFLDVARSVDELSDVDVDVDGVAVRCLLVFCIVVVLHLDLVLVVSHHWRHRIGGSTV